MVRVKTLAEACTPRREVLTGEFREEMFLARLNDVAKGQAHEIYQKPELFFANTHITGRVRSFFKEVLGRLSGKNNTASACFRLETPFGGGKTHTLIALYHLVTAPLPEDTLKRLGLSASHFPTEKVRTVVIVGDDLDPANGVDRNGLKVRHLWGELAWQLGGPEGYRLVERSDQLGQAPGPQFLDRLIGEEPTLILIDELWQYMRRMGPARDQLPPFMKTLTEWVTRPRSRTVLVLTLARGGEQGQRRIGDAFAEENEELHRCLKEVQDVLNRPIRIVTPSGREDYEPILRQRLFQEVDMENGAAVADKYMEVLRQAHQRGTPLPARVLQASYRDVLLNAYPFHPAFIDVLDGKLATLHNFQQTRGALRLLARVIRRLWSQGGPEELLIHPFMVDLTDPDIVDELTGRLDRPGFAKVVTYDIARADGQAHAQSIDRERFAGHPPYAQRIATTLFLHSLPEAPARGADLDELLAATLTPDSDPAHLQKALEYLQDEAWHLDFTGRRYFFQTEPSLVKIVLDETNAVPLLDARTEVERRIKRMWRDAGLEVVHFPAEPADLEDKPKGRLVLLHWDTATFTAGSERAPDKVRELWEYAGQQRTYRRFRNTLFFLVADGDRCDTMVQRARRWLALDRLLKDEQKLEAYRLGREQRQRLENWRNEADLELRVAITRAYCHLFYPAGEVDSPYRPLAYEGLPVEDQGDTRANHTETILRRLRELGKVKTAGDDPMAPALVRRDAFDRGEGSVALRTLFERYAERPRLPLLLEPTYLKEIVRLGVRNKVWLYYDKAQNLAYDDPQYVVDIVIDGDHEVMLPEEARKRGVPIYRPEPSRKSETQDESKSSRTEKIEKIEVEGEPGKALGDLAAKAKDVRWKAFGSLSLRWEGRDSDAHPRVASLRTLLGRIPDAVARVEVDLACEFADGGEWETRFKGPYSRYQALASTLENLLSQAQKAHATVELVLTFPKGLSVEGSDYQYLREALVLAGLGVTRFTAWRLEEKS